MSLSLACTESLFTVIKDKFAEEIDGGGVSLGQHVLVGDALTVWECDLAVVRQRGQSRPALLCGSAEVPDHDAQLVDVVLPWEQGAPVEQFTEDAADGPEVDPLRVAPGAVEEFRRSVPPGGHLMAVLPPLTSLTDPTEPEVCNLEPPLATYQQVGRLEVSVHDLVVVKVRDSLQQHQHVGLDLGVCQRPTGVFDDL